MPSKYVEAEAEQSGDETSVGDSAAGSVSEDDSMVVDDDVVEYESGVDSSEEVNHAALSDKELRKHRKRMEQSRRSQLLAAATAAMQEEGKRKPPTPPAKTVFARLSAPRAPPPTALASPDMPSGDGCPSNEAPPSPAPLRAVVKTKLVSNKVLHESAIPPKPASLLRAGAKQPKPPAAAGARKFVFRMYLTNGVMFHKFLLPIANAVHELRFNLTATDEFTGLRLEAHDTYLTLANKSRYECDIDAGVSEDDGAPLTTDALTGMSFCVAASSFMQTLGCATLKDTVLTITKYVDAPDKMTFESVSNENDVQAVYSCDVLAESRLESLDGMRFRMGYHVNVFLKTLKEQTINAKRCGASHIFFELHQAEDPTDEAVVHSRMSVGFKGTVTSGSHDFYQSARRLERKGDEGNTTTEWEPLAGMTLAERFKLKLERRSYNEYDNAKLRLFLNHMDVEWVLVHLCNDNTQQPLVMECMVGGKNIKHTIIVAPKLDEGASSDAQAAVM